MFIYKLTNKIDGKEYIGQTIGALKNRLKAHKCIKNNKCPYLKNAIVKYGWENFAVTILAETDSKSILDELEIKFIKEHNTMYPLGYNLKHGGQQGGPLSEASRKKLSISSTGRKLSEEAKRKLSEAFSGEKHPMFGKHRSEETKRKLSEANKGSNNPNFEKPRTEEVKEKLRKKALSKGPSVTMKARLSVMRKVICVETGEVFDSVTLAAKAIGVKGTSNLCKVLNGKIKRLKGLTFLYLEKT